MLYCTTRYLIVHISTYLMEHSKKRWLVAPPITEEFDLELRNFSPILRQILFNRGYRTKENALSFLGAFPPPGNDPENLLGLSLAVDRIWWAIKKQEPIAIYGDYDADGVTATALLTQALQCLGANVEYYIPNRFDEGYGLNTDAIDTLHGSGTKLIITVDCGIRSIYEAEHAQKLGLDLIITDHHQPGAQIPPARAVINPKQPGDSYPDKDLAGVGLAYKLMEALFIQKVKLEPSDGDFLEASDYLDLVALGTVADLVPLVNENRSLVRAGIEYIRTPNRQGVMSLIGAAQLIAKDITSENISYMLAPRLNAAGRLDSALNALKLLLTRDVTEAAYLAQSLDNQNRERQQITRDIQAKAGEIAMSEDPEAFLLFADDESFNPGVIGLAASKLCEQYYRPAIVAHRGEVNTRGSCRSIPEFHITDALDECSDLLVRHGGHAAAAGFTVQNQNLQDLKERIRNIARDKLSKLDLCPELRADALVLLSDLKPELINELEHLQPTGIQNPPASFLSLNAKVTRSKTVGKNNDHLRITVTDGHITYDAIAFQQGRWQDNLPPFIDLVYSFEINKYNGKTMLQLNVRDLRPAGKQVGNL